MWQQAKARAAETGSMIVWCDGGAGAVGGIVGGGFNEVVQVGEGSWTKTVGIQWPFDQRPTFFLQGGRHASRSLGILFAIVFFGSAIGYAPGYRRLSGLVVNGPTRVVAQITEIVGRITGSRRTQESELLIDV